MIIIKRILDTDTSLVAGFVKNYAEGIGQATGKVVNIRLDDGIEIAFWNSDDGTRKLATRAKEAGMKVGSFITALVKFKDAEQKKANALNFKYNGIWKFTSKPPVAEKSGIITAIASSSDKSSCVITLDDGSKYEFRNPSNNKGYHLADRIRAKAVVGYEIDISLTDGTPSNFKIGDEWSIIQSVHCIVGKVSFIDEGKSFGSDYIRLNTSIYDGKDETGHNVYSNAYVYFDNRRVPGMIDSIRKTVSPSSRIVIVSGKNKPNDDSDKSYTGYYYKLV